VGFGGKGSTKRSLGAIGVYPKLGGGPHGENATRAKKKGGGKVGVGVWSWGEKKSFPGNTWRKTVLNQGKRKKRREQGAGRRKEEEVSGFKG